MPVKYTVSNWNGTLFEPQTDEELYDALGSTKLKRALWRGNFWGAAAALGAGKRVDNLWAGYETGERTLAEACEASNRLVGNGMYVDTFLDAVKRYARTNASRVDSRMVAPLVRKGMRNCILSTSQRFCIRSMLRNTQFLDAFQPQDIVANRALLGDFVVEQLTTDNYGNKAPAFEKEFLGSRGFDPRKTVYAGDREDDLPIAGLLPRGNFVVPFYASSEFREMATSKYGAFAPADQTDWARFLAKK